jgi:hypothetical protein
MTNPSACLLVLGTASVIAFGCASEPTEFEDDLVSVYGSQIDAVNVLKGNFGAIPIRLAHRADLTLEPECNDRADEQHRAAIACVRHRTGVIGWVLTSSETNDVPGKTSRP